MQFKNIFLVNRKEWKNYAENKKETKKVAAKILVFGKIYKNAGKFRFARIWKLFRKTLTLAAFLFAQYFQARFCRLP